MPPDLLLGIEFGGTKLQIALGDGLGHIAALRTLAVDPQAGAAVLRDQAAQTARALCRDFAVDRRRAVGIGFGGPVDARRGVVIDSHQVTGWKGFAIRRWACDMFQAAHVAVGNDSDCAALAEARFGAAASLSPVLYVNSGSGIGGGLVVDGTLYRGGAFGAIEIGHLWLAPVENEPQRTLENTASGWAISAAARAAFAREPARAASSALAAAFASGELDTRAVAAAADIGDPLARALLDRATSAMAEALAHAVTLLAPRRIVLGGGVAEMDERLWVQPIREKLLSRVFPGFLGTFDVVRSSLGQAVVVQGALAIARDAAIESPITPPA